MSSLDTLKMKLLATLRIKQRESRLNVNETILLHYLIKELKGE